MCDIRCKVGERLRIGEQVVIKIVAVQDGLVHLRIIAPKTTVVWREKSSQPQKDVDDFLHSE
jgi:sRNA-binding carbon storage regulator CsrA